MQLPLTREFAQHFSEDWIAAWNAHDLEAILAHYSADFEMASPLIVQLAGEASGTLRGKPAVQAYWSKALARMPDLQFELQELFVGSSSIVICYRGPRGAGAEVFWFNPEGKVYRAAAHYAKP